MSKLQSLGKRLWPVHRTPDKQEEKRKIEDQDTFRAKEIAGMGKTDTERTINTVRGKTSKATTSGLIRLMEKASTEVTAIERVDGRFKLRIKNDSGEANVSMDENLPELIATACISGPSQELFEQVRDNIWQADVEDGPRPIAMLPLNSALWKIAGLGEEVVDKVRNTDFEYGHHVDRLHYERATVARTFGVLDDITTVDHAQAVSSQTQPPRRAFMSWMKYEWKMSGTTIQLRDEIKRLVNRLPDLPAGNLMTLAGFFCDAGEYGHALSLLKRAKAKSPNIWANTRIPALTHLLVREKLLKEDWAIREAELVDHIIKSETVFPEMMRKNRDSFAVVANGPRQIDTGAGSIIDSKDIVIRMNSGRGSAKFETDYGMKQTVWMKNPLNYDVKRLDKVPGVETVIVSGSGVLHKVANIGGHLRDLAESYGSVSVIPEEFLRSTTRAIQRNPSSGIVILTWLEHLVGGLEDQKNVFGYSLNDQKQKQTAHYYRTTPAISNHIHNWDAERDYFDTLVRPQQD
ncbi:glycosyltransferase family 29 protein [Brevundimonas olei]|uniref:glycosyltransferase family 29 protein n=1 Tax=Brevundimonas olei TaxID=657642 RepID=UPI0031E3FEFB